MKTVVFCVPTIKKPYAQCLASLEASVPVLESAGWDTRSVYEVGCPYISHARATMLRKALDIYPDAIVFIDHDLSWRPEDLLKLIETDGDMVAGVYRFKKDDEEYMGQLLSDEGGYPIAKDGGLLAFCVPAGFLKITPNTVDRFMAAYPNLMYGKKYAPHVDLFNHGAHEGVWYGEDYALSRNWLALGGEILVVPDLSLDHHSPDKSYPGNLHRFLLKQPGGSESTDTATSAA